MLNDEMSRRLQTLSGFEPEDITPVPSRKFLQTLTDMAAPMPGYMSPSGVDTSDTSIPGPHGDVGVRIYEPTAPETSPAAALVWCHGGAFIGGDLDMPEADCVSRELTARAQATVISVDYHLARGGIHFPVPHDDVKAVFEWVVNNASRLSVDPSRVGIGGASAGGNLAAGVALHLRDDGAINAAAVILTYPVLHCEAPILLEEPEGWEVIPEFMRLQKEGDTSIADNYLGGREPVPYAFPAGGDLRNLPPHWIVTCEYDGLRRSGEKYATELLEAGVEVHYRAEPTVAHGHLNIPGLPANEPTFDFLVAALNSMRGSLSPVGGPLALP